MQLIIPHLPVIRFGELSPPPRSLEIVQPIPINSLADSKSCVFC